MNSRKKSKDSLSRDKKMFVDKYNLHKSMHEKALKQALRILPKKIKEDVKRDVVFLCNYGEGVIYSIPLRKRNSKAIIFNDRSAIDFLKESKYKDCSDLVFHILTGIAFYALGYPKEKELKKETKSSFLKRIKRSEKAMNLASQWFDDYNSRKKRK